MFVQKLNPLTGEADWVLVNDPGLGDEDDASADLVATSSYLDMLTDSRRNAAYGAALRRVLPALAAARAQAGAGTAPPSGAAAPAAAAAASAPPAAPPSAPLGLRVLDIGTGTGLLAMMAAHALGHPGARGAQAAAAGAAGAGAEAGAAATGAGEDGPKAAADTGPVTAPVVACEVFPPMQNLSRRVIAANGLQEVVRVVNKRSDEMVVGQEPGAGEAAAAAAAEGGSGTARAAALRARARGAAAAPDMVDKVDLIVTEIFDSELLGEGMIPTMRHAVQHLIKDGGVVLPATATLYGQVLSCPLLHGMAGLRAAGPTRGPAAPPPAPQTPPSDAHAAGAAAAAAAPEAGAASGAAEIVLRALGELDDAARAAVFAADELYEIREIHIDMLVEHQQRLQGGQGEGGAAASQLLRPLSDPFPVFHFDWLRPPPPSGRKATVQVPINADGDAHVVLLWWCLGMEPAAVAPAAGGAAGSRPTPLLLSTAPCWVQAAAAAGADAGGAAGGRVEWGADGGAAGGVAEPQRWRDHWKQCWVPLAAEALTLAARQQLQLAFEHDDLNVRAKAKPSAQQHPSPPAPGATGGCSPGTPSGAATADAAAQEAPVAPGGAAKAKEVLQALQEQDAARQQLIPLLGVLGPQALMQLGDLARLSAFERALDAALGTGGGDAGGDGGGGAAPAAPAEVVVLDGSLALGLLAAAHPAVGSVTLLQESSVAASQWLAAAASRLGVSGRIRAVRSQAFFKRLTAGAAARAADQAEAGGAAGAAGGASAGPLVLLAEPYFSEFEQLVPWAHLKFWRDADVIRGSRIAGGGRRVITLPCRARLLAVAVALPELYRTRTALGTIEGCDLSPSNAVLGVVGGSTKAGGTGSSSSGSKSGAHGHGAAAPGAGGGCEDEDEEDLDAWLGGGDGSGSEAGSEEAQQQEQQPLPVLPYSVWQAGGGYVELSERAVLLDLELGGHLGDVEGAAVLQLRGGATGGAGGAGGGDVCHAVVLWLEYDLAGDAGPVSAAPTGCASGRGPSGAGGRVVVSTAPRADGGPCADVQGVYLLPQPVRLGGAGAGAGGPRLHVAASFDGLDADVGMEVTVLPPA